jgi:SulP family sulfate permease
LVIYDLEGELFFAAAPVLDRYLDNLRARIGSGKTRFVILRLKRVRHPDAVSIERLEHFLREHDGKGVTILLAGVRPDTLAVLRNVGIDDWFPADQIFAEGEQEFSATVSAVRYARARLGREGSDSVLVGADTTVSEEPNLYYLV